MATVTPHSPRNAWDDPREGRATTPQTTMPKAPLLETQTRLMVTLTLQMAAKALQYILDRLLRVLDLMDLADIFENQHYPRAILARALLGSVIRQCSKARKMSRHLNRSIPQASNK